MLLRASQSFSASFCLLSLCLTDCPSRRTAAALERPMLMSIVVFDSRLRALLQPEKSAKASLFCRLAHAFSPFAALDSPELTSGLHILSSAAAGDWCLRFVGPPP